MKCATKLSEVGGNDELSYETSIGLESQNVCFDYDRRLRICTQLDKHAISHNAKLQ